MEGLPGLFFLSLKINKQTEEQERCAKLHLNYKKKNMKYQSGRIETVKNDSASLLDGSIG